MGVQICYHGRGNRVCVHRSLLNSIKFLDHTSRNNKRTGKIMVDLTLNETFWFLDLYLKCGKEETRRAGAI